jgi:DNA-binding HxlR family transcriptional regulator
VTGRSEELPADARSKCPIANALDVLGDRWTLLVVRDLLFLKKLRYSELAQSNESIPTNILADRLKRLEEAGIVEKRPYRLRPPRYEYHLTPRGGDLLPILREMVVWANRHIPGTGRPPRQFFDRIAREAAATGDGPDASE